MMPLQMIFGLAVVIVMFFALAGCYLFIYSLRFDRKNFAMQSRRWKALWGFGVFSIAASVLAVFAAIGHALLR